MFVATHLSRPIGEPLEFAIYLPNDADPVRGVGEVRWARPCDTARQIPPGLGIRFIEFQGDGAERFASFLAACGLGTR
jgi:Tfp pilus assembly protein PilZ